jgi:hypothetical protein
LTGVSKVELCRAWAIEVVQGGSLMSWVLIELMGFFVERDCPKIWSEIRFVVVLACRIKVFREGAGMRGQDLIKTDPTRGYLRTGTDLTERSKILELNFAGSKRKGRIESRVFRAVRRMISGTIEGGIEATRVLQSIALTVIDLGT